MGKTLQSQLVNSHEIREILKEVSFSYTLSDGRDVKTLLVYLPIKAGKSCHVKFFEKIKEGILANFVLNCSEVERKLRVKNKNSAERLFNKAISKLSKHTAKGELGELILFTLLDVYLSAPKLLSKVSMKSSPKMPVYGADAVHGQYYEGKFRLFLGESKLYKEFKGAASEAAASIKDAKNKYENEFNLLDSHMDFPGIDDEAEAELLELLDPFSNNDLSDVIHSPCFIGFAQPEIIADEGDFLNKYKELAKDYTEDFFKKVEKQKIDINHTTLLMLPFSCVDELVNEFVACMGIAK